MFSFIFGATIGSFLNVCIGRIPNGESIIQPRSHCVHCQNPIAFFDNIPLISYLWLRGRCRACARRISVRSHVPETWDFHSVDRRRFWNIAATFMRA